MILSIDSEKIYDQIQLTFMIKALKKLRIKGMFLTIKKSVDDKHTANIILNGEQLKLFLLKPRMRQGFLFSPFLFNIILEFLSRAIRQEQEIKLLEIINSFGKIAG
jgi:hypothetical protein